MYALACIVLRFALDYNHVALRCMIDHATIDSVCVNFSEMGHVARKRKEAALHRGYATRLAPGSPWFVSVRDELICVTGLFRPLGFKGLLLFDHYVVDVPYSKTSPHPRPRKNKLLEPPAHTKLNLSIVCPERHQNNTRTPESTSCLRLSVPRTIHLHTTDRACAPSEEPRLTICPTLESRMNAAAESIGQLLKSSQEHDQTQERYSIRSLQVFNTPETIISHTTIQK